MHSSTRKRHFIGLTKMFITKQIVLTTFCSTHCFFWMGNILKMIIYFGSIRFLQLLHIGYDTIFQNLNCVDFFFKQTNVLGSLQVPCLTVTNSCISFLYVRFLNLWPKILLFFSKLIIYLLLNNIIVYSFKTPPFLRLVNYLSVTLYILSSVFFCDCNT